MSHEPQTFNTATKLGLWNSLTPLHCRVSEIPSQQSFVHTATGSLSERHVWLNISVIEFGWERSGATSGGCLAAFRNENVGICFISDTVMKTPCMKANKCFSHAVSPVWTLSIYDDSVSCAIVPPLAKVIAYCLIDFKTSFSANKVYDNAEPHNNSESKFCQAWFTSLQKCLLPNRQCFTAIFV